MNSLPEARLSVLVFSSLYPNAAQPRHGIFVEERLRHLVASGAVDAKVIAPVPWFPSAHRRFGRYGQLAAVPHKEWRHGIEVLHPRYPHIPKVSMSISPTLMAAALGGGVRRLQDGGFPFDLIDAHYFYPDGVAAVTIGKQLGKPVVVTARGTDVNRIANYRLPRWQIQRAAESAAGVVAVSRALKDRLVGLGVPEAKVVVLRNGVDLARFAPTDRQVTRNRLGITKSAWLSVGHLTELKGHHLAIDALQIVHDVKLLVIGEGPLASGLRRQAAQLGVSERVKFLGHVDHDQLPAYYSAADALVLPSRSEGMPNVLLEAMACGTPVIATAVGGIPEIICRPEAGELMDERSAAAVARAWGVLQRRWADGRTGEPTRAYAQRFSWSETTLGQLALFRRIAAMTTGPSPVGDVPAEACRGECRDE